MRLKTFGALALVARGEGSKSVRIPRRPLAVLAVLAAEGGAGITRDRMIGLFWPDKPESNARALLAQALHVARNALGAVVVDGGTALQLDPQVLPSDVEEFEFALESGDLSAAVSLYAGPFLDGFALPAAPEFERWAAARRAALANRFTQALIDLATAAVAAGDASRALEHARRAADADPCSGPAARALMRAHALAGDRPAALEAARHHRECVRERLGAEPDAAVVRLEEELRAGRAPAPANEVPGSAWPRPDPATRGAPSIAVLPFVNVSRDAADEFLADGLTVQIIDTLRRAPNLRIASRLSVLIYKDRSDDVRSVGRRLNVDHVLEGSVRRAGSRVRITGRLIAVKGAHDVWLGEFEREIDDIFEVQDEIAESVARTLQVALSPLGIPPRTIGSKAAYDSFYRGRYHWDSRAADRMSKALECYLEAIALEPDFATAHAYAAEAIAGMTFYGEVAPTESLPRARAAAERALSLDPSLAEAHTALGAVRAIHDHDWRGSAAEFDLALSINRQYVTAHIWNAILFLLPTGRIVEAIAELRSARRYDPISWPLNAIAGMLAYYAGRYDEAIDEVGRALAVEEAYPLAHYVLGRTLTERGETRAALAALDRALELTGGAAQVISAIGCARARAGDRAGAVDALASIEAQSQLRYVSGCDAAFVHAALGDVDAALAGFERGLEQRAMEMLWCWAHPGLAILRGHPRMAGIRARMRLSGIAARSF